MKREVAKPTLISLKGMVGKTFMYKGNNVVISDYEVLPDEGVTHILLENGNGEPLPPIKTANLTKFVESCLPVEEEDFEGNVSKAVIRESTNNLLTTLKDELLNNIKRVKADPKYIKQANVVNSSVNSLIGLAKIQLRVTDMKGK